MLSSQLDEPTDRDSLQVMRSDGVLEVRLDEQVIRVEPWGRDSLRVRCALGRIVDGLPGALEDDLGSQVVIIERTETSARIRNGAITAVIEEQRLDVGADLMLRFLRSDTGSELVSEQRNHFSWPGPRVFHPLGGGRHRLEQHFRAYDDERIYGLGQRAHGHLDQKGMTLDLVQRNSEITIPFMLSSRGYGLLWNNPGVGHVELANNRTRWVADAGRQIDYWITAGTPADVMARYADATGHAPELPSWASGFWQSKLRYRTQDELLAVARRYRDRDIPVAVIVADFFHWTASGDWRFDPAEWPDPAAMIAELQAMGTRLMVSIWPLVSSVSSNYAKMARRGLLVSAEHGLPFVAQFPEKGYPASIPSALHDPTNPEAREYLWSEVRRNYFDLGVRVWWLDACEPELKPAHPAGLRFHAGAGDEVYNLYPRDHARGFYEGMLDAGSSEVVSLCRSAWAGSQRYGAAVWSGDIPATWDSLRRQIPAGLSIALSGIPWWTTDIGGFHGGDPDDPAFRELVVRWFQYGAFCPLFRLHGDRLPKAQFGADMTGGPNEVWSFGDEAFEMISQVLSLRERIRPYIHEQMYRAHEVGLPPMRPLFVDWPDDAMSWMVEDEFLLGPDVLVAPVVELGARNREVYLPPGRWVDAWTGAAHVGATTVLAEAPLERIPVFIRGDASVPIAG